MARNGRNDKLRKERVGMKFTNYYGSEYTIIEYIDHQNVVAKFENGYTTTSRWNELKLGKAVNPYDKSVYGIGFIGEGEYKATVNGRKLPEYQFWHSMMTRCYKDSFHKNNPSYADITVAEEWHNFQSFSKWYKENYYEIENETMQLDKDIILKGNKEYSSDTCVFVPQIINNLLTNSRTTRGNLPLGVSFRKDKKEKPYQSSITTNGNRLHLGFFDNPTQAFKAHKIAKEKYIKKVASDYKNKIPDKVYQALMNYVIELDD